MLEFVTGGPFCGDEVVVTPEDKVEDVFLGEDIGEVTEVFTPRIEDVVEGVAGFLTALVEELLAIFPYLTHNHN